MLLLLLLALSVALLLQVLISKLKIMAFKKIPPKVRLCSGAPASALVVDKVEADGVTLAKVSHKPIADVYKNQVSAENFSLDKQIQAGVALKEVSSELLGDDINTVDESVLESFTNKIEPTEEPKTDE